MNQSQKNILWIGLIVVMVFLFTDQSFRNKIFGRGTSKPATKSAPYTAAQIFTPSAGANQIILDAATATQQGVNLSNSSPKVTLV